MDLLSPAHLRALTAASLLALTLAACGEREAEAPTSPPPPPPAAEPAPAPVEPPAFSAAGLEAIDARLEQLVANEDRSGVVMMLARDGEIEHISAAGYADIAAETPITADTPVRIASMTKPVTAAAIMMLVEDGVIALDDPVSNYILAFANARRDVLAGQ